MKKQTIKFKYLFASFLFFYFAVLNLSACKKSTSKKVSESNRPPVEVQAAVDKVSATIGDVITYTITINADPKIKVDIPEIGAEIAEMRVIDFGGEGPKKIEGRKVWTKWYKLQADIVGSYIIPPVKVAYSASTLISNNKEPKTKKQEPGNKNEKKTSEVSTTQIFIEIKSVMKEGEKAQDIRDIKPLEIIPRDYKKQFIIGLISLVVILILVGGIILYLKMRKKAEEIVKRPAHEIAFDKLKRLKEEKLLEDNRFKEYYFYLTEIFKDYLERRYGFLAAERTTEELLPEIERLDITANLKTEARAFSKESDLVKYADIIPLIDKAEQDFHWTWGFIESTKESVMEEEA
ncbi:MAG: hypothetical protein V1872_04600 [bacterium]